MIPAKCILGCYPFLSGGSVFVDSLFIVAPIVRGGSVFGPCFAIQYLIPYSFEIILMGKRELVALLFLCSGCLVTVGVFLTA